MFFAFLTVFALQKRLNPIYYKGFFVNATYLRLGEREDWRSVSFFTLLFCLLSIVCIMEYMVRYSGRLIRID